MVGIISVLGVLFSAVSIAVGNYKGKIILFGDTDLTYHFGKNFFIFLVISGTFCRFSSIC